MQGTLKNLWLHYNASSVKGSRSCSVGYCGDSLWRSSSNDYNSGLYLAKTD